MISERLAKKGTRTYIGFLLSLVIIKQFNPGLHIKRNATTFTVLSAFIDIDDMTLSLDWEILEEFAKVKVNLQVMIGITDLRLLKFFQGGCLFCKGNFVMSKAIF